MIKKNQTYLTVTFTAEECRDSIVTYRVYINGVSCYKFSTVKGIKPFDSTIGHGSPLFTEEINRNFFASLATLIGNENNLPKSIYREIALRFSRVIDLMPYIDSETKTTTFKREHVELEVRVEVPYMLVNKFKRNLSIFINHFRKENKEYWRNKAIVESKKSSKFKNSWQPLKYDFMVITEDTAKAISEMLISYLFLGGLNEEKREEYIPKPVPIGNLKPIKR